MVPPILTVVFLLVNNVLTSTGGPPSNGFSTGQIQRLGWTAGLGFEYALFGNFSTKAEFDYANFGSRNVTASDGTNIKANTSVEALKIGINYRFGGS